MANWQNDINVDLSFVNIDSFYMNFKWFRKTKTRKIVLYELSDSGKENKKGSFLHVF